MSSAKIKNQTNGKVISLSSYERERYLRQIIIPNFGEEAQLKLKNSSVLIIGAGGLGSPAGIYLSAAGIGMLGIIDHDTVSFSNLHRQVLFSESDIDLLKTEKMKESLEKQNPNVDIQTYPYRLNSGNAAEIISEYDIILDGSDNFVTKYLVNDACILTGKPFISGSVLKFEAQVSAFNIDGGPCYRCIFPSPAQVPDCSEAGVIGVVPGIAGIIMASEAIKYLTGIGNLLNGRLLLIDTLRMSFKEFSFTKNPDCKVCSVNPKVISLSEIKDYCINQTYYQTMQEYEISVEQLKEKLDKQENFFLLDVREIHEIPIASIGGHVIPLSELRDRTNELPSNKDEEIIVYCRTGNRSHHATMFLLNDLGYTNVKNLVGGIHAWHDKIDSSVKKY